MLILRNTTLGISNDDGIPSWYFEDVVMPLEKWRELQLKELGI